MEQFQQLQQRLAQFAEDRDWVSFHSPKNLSMALAGECGELLEHFQWLSEQESANLTLETRDQVRFEMADMQIYLMRLAHVLEVDLLASVAEKTTLNETRFPIEKVKGQQKRAEMYSEL